MFERKTFAVQGRVKIVNCTYIMDIHCHTWSMFVHYIQTVGKYQIRVDKLMRLDLLKIFIYRLKHVD